MFLGLCAHSDPPTYWFARADEHGDTWARFHDTDELGVGPKQNWHEPGVGVPCMTHWKPLDPPPQA